MPEHRPESDPPSDDSSETAVDVERRESVESQNEPLAEAEDIGGESARLARISEIPTRPLADVRLAQEPEAERVPVMGPRAEQGEPPADDTQADQPFVAQWPAAARQLPALNAPWRVQRLIIDTQLWELLLEATRRPTECGGVLIGDRDPVTQTVRALGFLFPRQHIANSTYCAFDMQWVSLTRAALMARNLDGRVSVIAWIHTHPRLSVFLSGTDVGTIDMLQSLNPLTLAVVLDPYAQDIGAFHVERHQRDVRISPEAIVLEEGFAAELRALLDAPQLSGAEVAAVVSLPELACPATRLGAKSGAAVKLKTSRPKHVPNEKRGKGGVGGMFSWLTRHDILVTKPLAPLPEDERSPTVTPTSDQLPTDQLSPANDAGEAGISDPTESSQ